MRNGRPLREHLDQHGAGRLPRWRELAEAGSSEAQFLVGWCHLEGVGVDKDTAQAVAWFRRSAEAGQPWAQFFLGQCHERGVGETRDPKAALAWYNKAAEQGNAPARYAAARLHFVARAPDKPDYTEGIRLLKLAAAEGHPESINQLGLCYWRGQGTARDLSQAAEWLQKGQALNCSWPRVNRMFRWNLALVYHAQALEARKQDAAEAERLTRQALALNEQLLREVDWHVYHRQRLGENHHLLGQLALDRDEAGTAAQHFLKAAELNNPRASEQLALLHEQGRGVVRDSTLADEIRRRAKSQGWSAIRVPCRVAGRSDAVTIVVMVTDSTTGDNPLRDEERRLREEHDATLVPEDRERLLQFHREAREGGSSFVQRCRQHYAPRPPTKPQA